MLGWGTVMTPKPRPISSSSLRKSCVVRKERPLCVPSPQNSFGLTFQLQQALVLPGN